MFTNEFEADSTVTTVIDETGQFSDVELVIADEGVYIRQFPEDDRKPADLIILTHKMFKDMVEALNYPAGFYKTEYKK